jgi:hypothetical protein
VNAAVEGMFIHDDQQNVRQLCEMADFIDSGFQSFREQAKCKPKDVPEAAFFCGASLVLKLLAYFKSAQYSKEDEEFLVSLIVFEISDYMEKHKMKLEWEPHVPSRWQQ